jgi:hypothetical protein
MNFGKTALEKYRARLLLVLACAFAAASVSWAVTPIAVTNTQALAFGKFAAGSGGAVTVNPNGMRSASGGVVLAASSGAAAQFAVSGDPNLIYAISLPADGTVVLSSGTYTMALNSFLSNPGGIGQLSAGGTQAVSVGATLSVGSNQAAGGYSGSFDVTVNYN